MATAPNRPCQKWPRRLRRAWIAPASDRRTRAGAAQPVGIGRHQDEMHVVRHQAPCPHFDLSGAAILDEQVAIKRIIGVAEESPRAAVATLGDMVRVTGDDDTGEAGHKV